jgi:ketosteroid isomerase-like protein
MSVPESIRTTMQQTNGLFDSAVIKKHNYDALDKIYTADARILPPGAPQIHGRSNIKEFWQNAIPALGVVGLTLSTEDAHMAGDSIVEVGRGDLVLGNGQTVAVKYVVLWKQEGGAWKWHTDIWNTNE